MYSPAAEKLFIRLYEDAQTKLASAYGCEDASASAEGKEEQDAKASQSRPASSPSN